MGNQVGVPTNEIQETAKEVIASFTPLYIKHYGLSLVKKIKEDRKKATSEYLLPVPPPASEPLMQGILTKQGAVRTSWRVRYFVAFNEADNYDVRYYEGIGRYRADPKHGKGAINLCWYRVERTRTDADKNAYGEFSVKLIPWWASDRRRAWYVRADDEETLKKWIATFEYAASKARPPLNPDPLMRRAFELAYRDTRWRLDDWGWYYYSRSEAEQLGVLIADRCERTCMRPVYAKIPSGAVESLIRNQLVSMLDQCVATAVDAGWKSVSTAIESQKVLIKAKADESIESVLTKQEELSEQVSAAILDKLRLVVEKGSRPVLGPISKVFLQPLFEAWREAINAFVAAMHATIAKVDAETEAAKKTEAWDQGLQGFERETCYWEGALYPAFKNIRDLTQYNPAVIRETFKLEIPLDDLMQLLDGVELWQIERQFEEGIREICRRGVYALRKEAESHSDGNKEILLAGVTAKMIHDAKVRAASDMRWIFESILMPPIRKHFLPTIKEDLESIKASVPDGMTAFLDVDDIVEDLVSEVVGGAISATLLPTTDTRFSSLDSLAFSDADAEAVSDPVAKSAADPVA